MVNEKLVRLFYGRYSERSNESKDIVKAEIADSFQKCLCAIRICISALSMVCILLYHRMFTH
jgi:hypothetical protein